MSLINIETHENTALVRLDKSTTNPIHLDLIEALSQTLAELKEDPSIQAVVLSSTNDKFFSIGFDIPNLYDLEAEEFKDFYRQFNQLCLDLYTFPKATIAALTGHAIAGGTILALCCDYRFIADRHKLMGLNELKLGAPVPYLADCLLRQLVGTRQARDITETAEFLNAQALLQAGVVDQVFPLEEVIPQALEKAQALASHPAQAYALNKANRTSELEEKVWENLEEKADDFLACWYSPQTRALLKEAMEKF